MRNVRVQPAGKEPPSCFDCVIVGGGASGLAAAIEASAAGCTVCVVEKLPRVGKKLLATGNGRCNFTHEPLFHGAFHGETALASRILLAKADPEGWFRSLGVLSRKDGEGRVYPYSNQASAVLDALRFTCAQNGVIFKCDFAVSSFDVRKGMYEIIGQNERLRAKRLILACGGCAAPSMGSTGDAFSLLKPFGVEVLPPRPALCPLPSKESVLRALKGLRVRAMVTAWRKTRKLGASLGEVQFQEQALSGICVFDLSWLVPQELSLDLLPDLEVQKVEKLLWELLRTRKTLPAEDWLTGLFLRRIGGELLKAAGIPLTASVSEVHPQQMQRLAQLCKDWRFAVEAPSQFATAQVTAGGIPASELSPDLELLRLPGCYVCGEAVNVHADCGGYNLSWAWASGRTVGCAAAESLRRVPNRKKSKR